MSERKKKLTYNLNSLFTTLAPLSLVLFVLTEVAHSQPFPETDLGGGANSSARRISSNGLIAGNIAIPSGAACWKVDNQGNKSVLDQQNACSLIGVVGLALT